MSFGHGVWEELEAGEQSFKFRQAAAQKTLEASIYAAKKDYLPFIEGARDADEFMDRISYVRSELTALGYHDVEAAIEALAEASTSDDDDDEKYVDSDSDDDHERDEAEGDDSDDKSDDDKSDDDDDTKKESKTADYDYGRHNNPQHPGGPVWWDQDNGSSTVNTPQGVGTVAPGVNNRDQAEVETEKRLVDPSLPGGRHRAAKVAAPLPGQLPVQPGQPRHLNPANPGGPQWENDNPGGGSGVSAPYGVAVTQPSLDNPGATGVSMVGPDQQYNKVPYQNTEDQAKAELEKTLVDPNAPGGRHRAQGSRSPFPFKSRKKA